MAKYKEVKGFIEMHHRNPSRYVPEERGLKRTNIKTNTNRAKS